MRVTISGIATLALGFLLVSIASGEAQVAPLQQAPSLATSFVPPSKIMSTLRSAGFDPLTPPSRHGAIYVARATDYRGILMRVVLDARTGAIRDANRIVAGPGPDTRVGTLPPYEPSPYRLPSPEMNGTLPLPSPASRAAVIIPPPLPRPRPAELAAKPAGDLPLGVTPPDMKSDATGSVPAVAGPAPVMPSRMPPPLTINN